MMIRTDGKLTVKADSKIRLAGWLCLFHIKPSKLANEPITDVHIAHELRTGG